MEERTRDDGFEATFVVSASRELAWERLLNAQPAADFLPKKRDGQWWIPGVEAPADELEVDDGHLLRARKAVEPCKGTEIVITFEDEESGSRITFVQTGFGEGFSSQRAWLTAGWHSILADLVVYFDRGVSLGRHLSMWSSIGCDVVESPVGLVVGGVRPDGFAHQAGLERGDVICRLDGSPVLNIRELAALVRGPLRTGYHFDAEYLRGTEVLTGSGTI